FNLREEDIHKASFGIFIMVSFFGFFIFAISSNILIFFFSFLLSLIVSYEFTIVLYRIVKKEEKQINTIINLLKLDFNLIQKTLAPNIDHCLSFILFMIKYDTPLSNQFSQILTHIHNGANPEALLSKMVTPSKDFDDYIKQLSLNNFQYNENIDLIDENSLEKDFRVHLKQIQNKIAIIFFIGLFFPIGYCFLVVFQLIPVYLMMMSVPIFILFLYALFKKFVKIDFILVGMISGHSALEFKKFKEFLKFIKNYAVMLNYNSSPEKALIDAYNLKQNDFELLKIPIENSITNLITDSFCFNDVMEILKVELKTVRYSLILESIKKMISENAYYSSKKILDILHIIYRHQKLERELNLIIRGEKFKVFIFLILLPIIIGSIGGMFPFFSILNDHYDIFQEFSYYTQLSDKDLVRMFLIFFTLLSCVVVTSYFFLKIISHNKKIFFILITVMTFSLVFILSITTILNII
ncbi:MAG: hypothetical protein ACFE8P_07725, partial [Promethearchaeota archaeon]